MKKVQSNAKDKNNAKATVASYPKNKNNFQSTAVNNKEAKNNSTIKIQKKTKEKVVDDTPPSQKLLHQIMPFVMYVIALFLIVAFIMIDLANNGEVMGIVGQGVHDIICGLLGVGAFFIPLLVIFLGAFWRKNIDDGKTSQKALFAFLTLVFVSALFHVSEISANNISNSFNFTEMWRDGIDFSGGGVIGGVLGNLLHFAFGSVGSLIIVSSVVFIFSMFFFGLTPRSIFIFIRYRTKLYREKKELALVEAKKMKKHRRLNYVECQ